MTIDLNDPRIIEILQLASHLVDRISPSNFNPDSLNTSDDDMGRILRGITWLSGQPNPRSMVAADAVASQSSSSFNDVMQSMVDSIIVSDSTGMITLVNKSACQLLGFEESDLLGRQIDSLYPTDAKLDPVYSGPLTEEVIVGKDGTQITVSRSCSALYSGQGALPGHIHVLRDITQQKQAEAVLRENNQTLQAALDTIPVRVFWKDTSFRLRGCNRLFVQDSGESSIEALLGKADEDFFKEEEPIWAEQADAYRATDRQVVETGVPLLGFEEVQKRPDGKTHWIRTSKIPMRNSESRIIGLVGTYEDITDRKMMEVALRDSEFLLRKSQVVGRIGSYVFDARTGQWASSPVLDEIFGIDGQFQRDIGGWISIVHPSEQYEMQSYLTQYVIAQHNRFDREYRILRLDNGQERWVHGAGEVEYDENGAALRMIGVIVDVTVRKRLENELRQALARERELNELKSRFISVASHEFRTPMATIRAAADAIRAYRGRMTDAQIDGRLQKINDQILRLSKLMDDVLTLSRMQMAQNQFKQAALDLDSFCKEIIEEFASRPDVANQLIYRSNVAPALIQSDQTLIHKVLDNLLSNAIKYSSVDSPIEISLDRVADRILMKVQDHGIGIPAKDMTYLFEPFHRCTNVGEIAGTGLGLSIVKQSVELMSGTIRVESALGAGTTFEISLPSMMSVTG